MCREKDFQRLIIFRVWIININSLRFLSNYAAFLPFLCVHRNTHIYNYIKEYITFYFILFYFIYISCINYLVIVFFVIIEIETINENIVINIKKNWNLISEGFERCFDSLTVNHNALSFKRDTVH